MTVAACVDVCEIGFVLEYIFLIVKFGVFIFWCSDRGELPVNFFLTHSQFVGIVSFDLGHGLGLEDIYIDVDFG